MADNGCGFDYNNVCKNTKGQGLSMIRDRLYIFNGSVKVTKIMIRELNFILIFLWSTKKNRYKWS